MTFVFDPGNAPTYASSADIAGAGLLLMVSGSGTVATCTAAATSWLGSSVAASKSGDLVRIDCDGIQPLKASGSIPAGSPVIAGVNGTVAASATPPAGQQVGVAITAASDGQTVEVRMAR